MRIAQVVADGRPGGGTVMVLALVEELVRHGHRVTLVTDAGSEAERAAGELGATAETLHFFSPLTATRRVAAILDGLDPEVVHVHGSRAGYHVARWVEQRVFPAAHYTVHGYHFHHRWWPRSWLGRRLERRTGPTFPSVIHVCRHDRLLAERWGLVAPTSEAQVVYNGVAIERLPRPVAEEPPRVAFIGRLVHQKHPRRIAAIARRLAASGIPSTIVGGGRYEGEVRRRLRSDIAAGRVELLGSVDHRGALTELARASVLVLPSRWEGLPVVALEALALGVAVVAAPVGGIPEVIVDGETGVLVRERSAAAFAEAARRLIVDPERRRRFREAGRRRVEERFTLERFLAGNLGLYGLDRS